MMPIIRLLEQEDLTNYLQLLQQLTEIGTINEADLLKQFELVKHNPLHHIYLVEYDGHIVGCGTLLIEPKFIHQLCFVAHIEDVVIDCNYRNHRFGTTLLNFLIDQAKACACYKVILNCSDAIVPFYSKCGFERSNNEMSIYFNLLVR